MQCPKCKVDMKEGVALNPNGNEDYVCKCFGIHHLTAETLKIIECLKCPSCGHSDDLR